MSTDSDKQERSRLQHEAEHERPHKRSSVLLYLVILFAAAFLLLLMSYFMQQRANQEAMDKLEQTSDSATQSLENILQENETLKVENEALSQQVAQLYTTTGATPMPGMRRPPPRPLWLERAAWRGYWVRWPMGSPASSDRTTTPWRPTSPSWSGWADCFT